jgi:hypothetical protein
VNPLLLIQSQTSPSLVWLSSEKGEGFLQVLGVLGKLLDALHNAGTVIVIGNCRFHAA